MDDIRNILNNMNVVPKIHYQWYQTPDGLGIFIPVIESMSTILNNIDTYTEQLHVALKGLIDYKEYYHVHWSMRGRLGETHIYGSDEDTGDSIEPYILQSFRKACIKATRVIHKTMPHITIKIHIKAAPPTPSWVGDPHTTTEGFENTPSGGRAYVYNIVANRQGYPAPIIDVPEHTLIQEIRLAIAYFERSSIAPPHALRVIHNASRIYNIGPWISWDSRNPIKIARMIYRELSLWQDIEHYEGLFDITDITILTVYIGNNPVIHKP